MGFPISKFPAVRRGNDVVRFAFDQCLLVESREPGIGKGKLTETCSVSPPWPALP